MRQNGSLVLRLIATAGHDTTSYALAGGMLALLQHPDQFALLRNDPDSLPTAVEEMLRWTTPVRGFMRTAQRDTEIGGSRSRPVRPSCSPSFPAGRDEAGDRGPDAVRHHARATDTSLRGLRSAQLPWAATWPVWR